jgi:hypothetical protein
VKLSCRRSYIVNIGNTQQDQLAKISIGRDWEIMEEAHDLHFLTDFTGDTIQQTRETASEHYNDRCYSLKFE